MRVPIPVRLLFAPRNRTASRRALPGRRADMARISASVYTSHVPAIGAAMDLGKTSEPYWQKVFSGYDF